MESASAREGRGRGGGVFSSWHEKELANIRVSCYFALLLRRISIQLKARQGKRVGVYFMEMGVYLAPVLDMS